MGASGLAVHPHGLGQHPRQTPKAGLLSERFGVAAARGSGEAPRWRHHQERPRHASVTARRILLLVPTRAGGRAEAAGSPRRYAMDRLDVVVHGGWFCGPVPPCSCHDWPTGPQGHRVGHHSAPGGANGTTGRAGLVPGRVPGRELAWGARAGSVRGIADDRSMATAENRRRRAVGLAVITRLRAPTNGVRSPACHLLAFELDLCRSGTPRPGYVQVRPVLTQPVAHDSSAVRTKEPATRIRDKSPIERREIRRSSHGRPMALLALTFAATAACADASHFTLPGTLKPP
jgi:hypothetical protein